MIQQKKKYCKDCGKLTYLWAYGRCKFCDQKHRQKKANEGVNKPTRGLSRKSNGYIPPRTDKRLHEELQYKKLIKEIDKEAKETKQIECFFCGENVENAEHHHLAKRANDLLIDRAYIVRVHSKCHRDYHNKPVKQLKWFMDYVGRLTKIDPVLASKELMKYGK